LEVEEKLKIEQMTLKIRRLWLEMTVVLQKSGGQWDNISKTCKFEHYVLPRSEDKGQRIWKFFTVAYAHLSYRLCQKTCLFF